MSTDPTGEPLSHEAYVARLERARRWHLVHAGRQRMVAVKAVAASLAEAARHDAQVALLDAELAALGRPQPPITPGAA